MRATVLEGPAEDRERRAGWSASSTRYLGEVASLVRDLGGHDLADVLDALRRARETPDRPTVIFAYTIKGYGLEIAGRPQNHSALLDGEQIDRLRDDDGADRGDRVGRLRVRQRGGARCSRRHAAGSTAATTAPAALVPVPATLSDRDPGRYIDAGGIRARAARALPRRGCRRAPRHRRARRLHLHQPRWLHQQDRRLGPRRGTGLRHDGRLAAEVARRPERPAHRDGHRRDEPRPPARPTRPQLGLPGRAALPDRHPLRPIRDARPRRDRLLHLLRLTVRPRRHPVRDLALARGRRPPVALNTPGIGIETPGLTYAEPCYARELEWLLLDALARMQTPDGEALYLRLSTSPIDQAAVHRGSGTPRRGTSTSRRRRRRLPPPRARPERRPRHPRRLRRHRARGARSRHAARRGGRRRSDRALPLLPRPALPRLACTPTSAPARRHRRVCRTSSAFWLPTSGAYRSSP